METFKNLLDLNLDQKKLLTQAKQKFLRKSVQKKEISNYEQHGYIVASKTKNKAIMKILKPEVELAYNEFLQLFCEMGFDIIPNIPHSFGDDVRDISDFSFISADCESILICYYLFSNNKNEISNFKKLINEIKVKYNNLLNELKSIFGNNKKYKVILCTKNFAISNEDLSLIQSLKFYFINDERLEYYSNLNKHLGKASKFQLLGNLFSGQRIENLDEVIPAIQGRMGGYVYYSFSIEPVKLLKISYILHRTDANKNDMPTYQRLIKKSRLKQIETFINKGGFFPNSVIISIDTNKKGLTFDLSSLQDRNSISKIGLLHLPQRYKSAYIIDGQHRLYGYSNTEYKETNTIPVVAFLDLAKNEQVKLFMEINENQKSVSKNLRTTLNSDLLWDSKNPTDRNTALFSKIAQELGENTDSPLFNRIIIGENNKTDKCCITLDTIRDALDKSGFFNKYLGTDIDQKGFLDLNNNERNLKNIFALLVNVFNYIRKNDKNGWNEPEEINKWVFNLSIYAIIRIAADITSILLKANLYNKNNISDYFEDFQPYFDVIIESIKNLSDEQRKDLKTSYGGGGRIKYWRTLQGYILDKFPEITFNGYKEWELNNTKKFNAETFTLIGDIETKLKAEIKEKLSSFYGNNWKTKGVPMAVMENARNLKTKKDYENVDNEPEVDEWDCMYLSDYRKIILYKSHWQDLFVSMYSDPTMTKGNKDQKTEWLDKLNKIRNKNDHIYSVKEEEYKFVKRIYDWLFK